VRTAGSGVLLPEYLDDYVSEENPVRVVEAFVDAFDLAALGPAFPSECGFQRTKLWRRA
jgi:transposase